MEEESATVTLSLGSPRRNGLRLSALERDVELRTGVYLA